MELEATKNFTQASGAYLDYVRILTGGAVLLETLIYVQPNQVVTKIGFDTSSIFLS